MYETALSSDYKRGNEEGKKIILIFKILEKNRELALSSIPVLLSDSNVVTRSKAASHCLSLGINIDDAVKVLENVVKEEKGNIFGFNAQMTLKVWRGQGYLKVYSTQKVKSI